MDLSWINNLALAGGITLALYFAVRLVTGPGGPPVDDTAVRSALQRGGVVIDVRTAGEYGAGHIEGARNLPLDGLPAGARTISPKSRPLLVYCRSGSRSKVARDILERAGFDTVIDLGSQTSANRALQTARSSPAATVRATP